MDKEQFIKAIKSSKKYKEISEEIIRNKVEEFFNKYDMSDEKFMLKEIKASLHKLHGSFRFADKKLGEDLEKGDFESILSKNRSTKERLEDYELIYEQIFDVTGKPNSILDLGAGLNPVSIPLMKLGKNIVYYSYDINDKESKFINKFFEKFKINGKSEILDLTRIENVDSLPSADLCLMFKLIDVLEAEKKGHKYAEEIIQALLKKTKFIVVSFAKLTVSGDKMSFPQRGWIERMLERLGLEYSRFEINSEIFYIIKK